MACARSARTGGETQSLAALKIAIERAIAPQDEELGAAAHEALIDAEHRQRVIATVRRCSR